MSGAPAAEPGEITVALGAVRARFGAAHVDRDHPGRVFGTLLRGRFYEEDLLAHAGSLPLGPGCCVDLGAAVGTHTVFFALACGGRTVHAFEPRPDLFDQLRHNVALNPSDAKVVLHQVALADRRGRVPLGPAADAPTAACQRLDRLVAEPVALLKVDVDGMEPEALRGAARILRRDRPVVLVAARTAPDYEAVVRTLARSGHRPTGRTFGASAVYEFVVDPERAGGAAARWARSTRTRVRTAIRLPRRAARSLARRLPRRPRPPRSGR